MRISKWIWIWFILSSVIANKICTYPDIHVKILFLDGREFNEKQVTIGIFSEFEFPIKIFPVKGPRRHFNFR